MCIKKEIYWGLLQDFKKKTFVQKIVRLVQVCKYIMLVSKSKEQKYTPIVPVLVEKSPLVRQIHPS